MKCLAPSHHFLLFILKALYHLVASFEQGAQKVVTDGVKPKYFSSPIPFLQSLHSENPFFHILLNFLVYQDSQSGTKTIDSLKVALHFCLHYSDFKDLTLSNLPELRRKLRRILKDFKKVMHSSTKLVEREISKIHEIQTHKLAAPGHFVELYSETQVGFPITFRDSFLIHQFFVLQELYSLKFKVQEMLLIQDEIIRQHLVQIKERYRVVLSSEHVHDDLISELAENQILCLRYCNLQKLVKISRLSGIGISSTFPQQRFTNPPQADMVLKYKVFHDAVRSSKLKRVVTDKEENIAS